jgi:hypothetical protein
MKFLTIALAVSGVVSAGSLGAQVVLPGRTTTVPAQQRTDCNYVRTTNSVGDIIFGRANVATNCRDVHSREDGAWYQVGRGRDNNSIYERRVPNDKQWKKAMKAQRKAYERAEKAEDKDMKARLKAGTITKDQYEAWKRADKEQDKVEKAQMKANEKAYKGKNK